ncbi:MAG TPA: S49 family peptidase [Candidatus Eisenbacteria bacterium]|nr:S49 family peptidase [Candidatus Eisenbacteria bacterium]
MPARAPGVRAALAALLALAWATPGRATSPTPPPSLLVTGEESAATVDGGAAMWLNPAGLGERYPSELLIAWTRFGAKREINDEVLTLGGFALHAERDRDTSQTYGFGYARGGERLRMGATAVWRLDARNHEVDADHAFGVQSKLAPWLALGGAVDHMFQPIFRQARQNRVYTLALGLRPLALSRALAAGPGTRLTFTGDVLIPDDGEWRQSRVRIGAELEPFPGVLVRGAVEDHRGVHVGIALRAPTATLAAHQRRVAGDWRGDSEVLSLHGGEERAALIGRGERRIAEVGVSGALSDQSLTGFTLTAGGVATRGARPLREQLVRALDDPQTRGVLLDVRDVSNLAQLEELRPHLTALRRAGKPVVAWMEEGGGRGSLYLASACDRVVAGPESDFSDLGLRVERRYWRTALDRWGVRVDRTAVGAYKSAFRNWSADSTSPADREQIERQLDVQQALFEDTLLAARPTDRARLAAILDGRPWRARDLVRAGLVDSIGYREDAVALAGTLAHLGRKPRVARLDRIRRVQRAWTVPTRVAVVYATGAIQTGASGNDLLFGPAMGSATVVRQLESAFRRRDVRAVVLRVESPGGSALASDLIYHATDRLKRETKKPFVVSMGAVAASGGYYISAAGDRIFADRFTRTGSIGVVSWKPSFEQWYRAHRVHEDDFTRGAHTDLGSAAHDWSAEDQAIADSATRRYYDDFVARVARGRGRSAAEIDAAGEGRVWMAGDARAHHLVDDIGGLDQAIAEARRRAGIPAGETIRLAEYGAPRPGLFQRLIGRAVGEVWERELRTPDPGELLLLDDVAAP